jgi:N-acetylglutamate synthase-like GNAT family acetyltransferase
MAWKEKKEQPVEGEMKTAAGIITLEPTIREIIRKLSGEGPREYYVYLESPDSSEKRRIGFVSFAYKTEADMASTKSNLSDKDRIVEIKTFYPSLYVPRREKAGLRQQEIGPTILNHLLKEWESEGIAGVYCKTTARKMQHLLKKSGFHYVEKSIYSNIYFKKLGSEGGVETQAGIVKLTSEDPHLHIIKDSPSKLYGRMKKYEVVLKPPDSPEEMIGAVVVTCRKVADEKLSEIHGKLLEKGLKDEDKIIDIGMFYPYPEIILVRPPETPPDYKKKGIGTVVLKQLLKEFKSEGFAGVYGHTVREGMQDFLRDKFGFEEVVENHFFKKL